MAKPYLANPAPINQQHYVSDQGLADFSGRTIEYCDGPGPGLNAEKVHALRLSPYASPKLLRPVSTGKKQKNLPNEHLVKLLLAKPLIRHTTVPNAWPAWLHQAGLQERVHDAQLSLGPQYDLLSMALHGAIGGLGVALLPDYMTFGAVDTGQLVKLSAVEWVAPKAYYLRYPHWKAELPVVKLFSAWLVSLDIDSIE